jgi:quercetin dioxygenase-like cupin family protein
MMEETDVPTLQRLISRLRDTARELRRHGGHIPAVDRNAARLLASVRMLEINCGDIEEPSGENPATDTPGGGKAMFAKAGSEGYIEPASGVRLRSMTYGESTHLIEFRIRSGTVLAEHAHAQEQTGYLVSGSMTLTIDNVAHEVEPGDSWSIPGNVPHSAEFRADSVVVEVFCPHREEFK